MEDSLQRQTILSCIRISCLKEIEIDILPADELGETLKNMFILRQLKRQQNEKFLPYYSPKVFNNGGGQQTIY